jgi:hypothetical protein
MSGGAASRDPQTISQEPDRKCSVFFQAVSKNLKMICMPCSGFELGLKCAIRLRSRTHPRARHAALVAIRSRSIGKQSDSPLVGFERASQRKRVSGDSCRRYAGRARRWSAPASMLRHWSGSAFSGGSTAGLVQRSLWCSGESDFSETATYPSVRRCPSAFGVWVSISGVDVGQEWASYYTQVVVVRQPTLASPDIAS